MQPLIVKTPEEFCFSECLIYLSRSTLECMHKIETDIFKKAIRLGGDIVVVEVRAHPALQELEINYAAPEGNPGVASKLEAYLRDVFDLDTDLQPYYQLAASDPLLKQVVAQHYGLRLIGIPDLFEAVCWAIIGQQINLRFAYTLKQRFVMQFGEAVAHEGATFYLFPEPAVVAGLSITDLKPLQFSGRKAAYLIGAARAIENGELSKEKLQVMSFEEAVEALVQLKGIGRWTANYVILKCLKMPDAFPIDDVGLHHALRHLMQLEQKPDLTTIEQLAQPWKGWRAYTTFYLWQTLLNHE